MVERLYENPVRGLTVKDCYFYHKMEMPDTGLVGTHWDLRGKESQYLGNVDFAGKRVLEIGPASGYLTAYMEKMGAEIVAVEQPREVTWDFVPYNYSDEKWEEIKSQKRKNNEKLKNSFWLTHEKLNLNAKVHYGSVSNLPEELGKFHISTIGLVLTHTRDPITIIENCARRTTEKMIVTERLMKNGKEDPRPVIELLPRIDLPRTRVGAWWYFSEAFFNELFRLMGFSKITVTHDSYTCLERATPLSTFVAEW